MMVMYTIPRYASMGTATLALNTSASHVLNPIIKPNPIILILYSFTLKFFQNYIQTRTHTQQRTQKRSQWERKMAGRVNPAPDKDKQQNSCNHFKCNACVSAPWFHGGLFRRSRSGARWYTYRYIHGTPAVELCARFNHHFVGNYIAVDFCWRL